MAEAEPQPKLAWQPFTPGGVARFATATPGQVWLIQLLMGAVVGLTAIWFVHRNFSPVLLAAIREMPPRAILDGGRLRGVDSGLLANGHFLSVVADLEGVSETGTADFQISLGENNLDVCSLHVHSVLGCLSTPYPENYTVLLARDDAEPWWNAWHPMILAGLGLAMALALIVTWGVMALLYSGPVWLIGYFADRNITLVGSWRLAVAAQMPAALFMTCAIFLYGLEIIDLIHLLYLYVLHMVVAWIYLLAAPFMLPKLPRPPEDVPLGKNPFASSPPEK